MRERKKRAVMMHSLRLQEKIKTKDTIKHIRLKWKSIRIWNNMARRMYMVKMINKSQDRRNLMRVSQELKSTKAATLLIPNRGLVSFLELLGSLLKSA